MQGGESCRNICVVSFSLCKTTTLRVEPSAAAVQPAQTSSDSHHCQRHHHKQRNNKQRLFIVIIVANLIAGVDSTSSTLLCQHHNWRKLSSAPSKMVGCRHLKWSIMLLKFFFTSTGVICVSREKWSNQTWRFPLIWSWSVHKNFMHWSAPRLQPHTQFGCSHLCWLRLLSLWWMKEPVKTRIGAKGKVLGPQPHRKKGYPVPPAPKNTLPELPCPAPKKGS